jgi:hypothetical protein
MDSGILRPRLHHTLTKATGFPAFRSSTLNSGYLSGLYRPQDKSRNYIPRLNSPLPNFKLVLPYGEYRATYVEG